MVGSESGDKRENISKIPDPELNPLLHSLYIRSASQMDHLIQEITKFKAGNSPAVIIV
jgi:hypothetical protein